MNFAKDLDLPTRIFLTLRDELFDEKGKPKSFTLRPKKSTQDDPFDEYLHGLLKKELGCEVHKASPLVSPDIVVFDRSVSLSNFKNGSYEDLTKIVALEVKKLNRTDSGMIARKTGLDYNSTPPCGKVRVYNEDNKPLNIRAFYLFVCLEENESEDNCALTSFVLCDGNALNMNFDLYLSAVESREKEIKLGTYGDGLNRNRPMFVFSNPLGLPEMDRRITLIHWNEALQEDCNRLKKSYELSRSSSEGDFSYWCYWCVEDFPQFHVFKRISDFPTPDNREEKTQSRGRFRLPIK